MNDGRYVSAPLVSRGRPLWKDLYRVGVIGGMSRVAPFGPGAFYPRVIRSMGSDDLEAQSSVTRTLVTLSIIGLIVTSPYWVHWMLSKLPVSVSVE